MSQEKNHLGMARVLSAQFGVAVEASQAERFFKALNVELGRAFAQGRAHGRLEVMQQRAAEAPSESQVRH